jgi:hypothetical protein
MLRSGRTLRAAATEFTDSGRKKHPPWGYNGMSYLFSDVKRTMWTRAVRVQTTKQNRLVGYRARLAPVIDEIDVEESVKKVATFSVDDLRVDDFRRAAFRCSRCGDLYSRSLKGRVHYGKGCPRGCDAEHNDLAVPHAQFLIEGAPSTPSTAAAAAAAQPTPSIVATAGVASKTTLREHGKGVLDRLQLCSEKGSKERLGDLPAWCRSQFNFKCADCAAVFPMTVRAQTGVQALGMPHLGVASLTELCCRCPACRHKLAMGKAAKLIGDGTKGYYGGLAF